MSPEVESEYFPNISACASTPFLQDLFSLTAATWCSVRTRPAPTLPGVRQTQRSSWTLTVAPCRPSPRAPCTCPASAGRRRGGGGARRPNIDPRTPPGSGCAWWPSTWPLRSWGSCCRPSRRTRSCPRSRSCGSPFVTSHTCTTCWMFRLWGGQLEARGHDTWMISGDWYHKTGGTPWCRHTVDCWTWSWEHRTDFSSRETVKTLFLLPSHGWKQIWTHCVCCCILLLKRCCAWS